MYWMGCDRTDGRGRMLEGRGQNSEVGMRNVETKRNRILEVSPAAGERLVCRQKNSLGTKKSLNVAI